MSDQTEIWQQIRTELDALKKENTELKKELDDMKQKAASVPVDPEFFEALAELDSQSTGEEFNPAEAKQELSVLLDDLEGMIEVMNDGTGMGLVVPDKLNQIRKALKE